MNAQFHNMQITTDQRGLCNVNVALVAKESWKTTLLWGRKQVVQMQTGIEGGSQGIYSIINVHHKWSMGVVEVVACVGGWISRLCALADDQCLSFIFPISEGAAGSFLIKSWLFHLAQEPLITFCAGACLIVWLLPHFDHSSPTPINSSEHQLLLHWFVTVTVNSDDRANA